MSNAGVTYDLYEAPTKPSHGVTVTFNQTGTMAGVTSCAGLVCVVNLNLRGRTQDNVQATATHELGHALGLT
jgi:hypothetical protein